MLCIYFGSILFMSTIYIKPGHSHKHEQLCYDTNNPIGIYFGIHYQLVYITEKTSLDLACGMCNTTSIFNQSFNNAFWFKLELSSNITNPVYNKLRPKSKKFRKQMRLLTNGTLHFNKIHLNERGLYVCSNDKDVSKKSTSISIGYLVQVNDKKLMSSLPNGTMTDWNKYRDNVLPQAWHKLENRANQFFRANVTWSPWTGCLCGAYKFDTRRFRYAYPYVLVNESEALSLLFPIQSSWLQSFYPELARHVENVSIFQEYERCVGECTVDAVYEDVDYRYEESVYLAEGSDVTLTCPDTENATEILWVTNETSILHKGLHSLGTADHENHIAVDLIDELHLTQVGSFEEGVYSCFVNTLPVKKITVVMVPKSLFLSTEFLNSVLRIAYVLLICFFICVLVLCVKIYYINVQYKE